MTKYVFACRVARVSLRWQAALQQPDIASSIPWPRIRLQAVGQVMFDPHLRLVEYESEALACRRGGNLRSDHNAR
jgi:hypothetical protein